MRACCALLLVILMATACGGGSVPAVSEKESRYVIDVRSRAEWDAGHLDGAILIPHDQIQSEIGKRLPDKQAPISLYCRSGRRSGIAMQTLKSMGYQDVQNLGSLEDARRKASEVRRFEPEE